MKLEDFRDPDDYSIESFQKCILNEFEFIEDGDNIWHIHLPFHFSDGDEFYIVYRKEKYIRSEVVYDIIDKLLSENIIGIPEELMKGVDLEKDCIKKRVESEEIERWILTDEGHTVFHMSIFDVDSTPEEIIQRDEIQRIIMRAGIEVREKTELFIDLTDYSRLGMALFRFIKAISEIECLYDENYMNQIKGDKCI